jgi:hypothetical protein
MLEFVGNWLSCVSHSLSDQLFFGGLGLGERNRWFGTLDHRIHYRAAFQATDQPSLPHQTANEWAIPALVGYLARTLKLRMFLFVARDCASGQHIPPVSAWNIVDFFALAFLSAHFRILWRADTAILEREGWERTDPCSKSARPASPVGRAVATVLGVWFGHPRFSPRPP